MEIISCLRYFVRNSAIQLRNFTFRAALQHRYLNLIILSPNKFIKPPGLGKEFCTKINAPEFIRLRELKYISEFIDNPDDEEYRVVKNPYERLKDDFGVQTNALEVSVEKASALLHHLQEREKEGLASPKQVQCLMMQLRKSKVKDVNLDAAEVTKSKSAEYAGNLEPNADVENIEQQSIGDDDVKGIGFNRRSEKYRSFYTPYMTGNRLIEIFTSFVIKEIFSEDMITKDFLECILIGKDKILPEGTMVDKDIKHIRESHKKLIFCVQINTSHGIFRVEMQASSSLDCLKKEEFCNAAASSEDGIKSQPIIQVTIFTSNVFNDDVPCVSYHSNVEQKSQQQQMRAHSYAFIELEKFDNSKYDQTNITTQNERDWLSFMKNQELGNTYANPAVNEAIKCVRYIRDNHYDYYVRYLITEMAAINELKEARERGRQIGLERGRQEGLERGRQEARERGGKEVRVECARSMLKDNQSVDWIMRICKLTREELESLRGELKT